MELWTESGSNYKESAHFHSSPDHWSTNRESRKYRAALGSESAQSCQCVDSRVVAICHLV